MAISNSVYLLGSVGAFIATIGPIRSEEYLASTQGRLIAAAVEKALPLIETSASQTLRSRDCYTCHHGGHGMMAMTAAYRRGRFIQFEVMEAQIERAYAEMIADQPRFAEGFSASGTIDGPSSAIWLLGDAGWRRDNVLVNGVTFLLSQQKNGGQWETEPARPPSVGSSFAATYQAMRAIKHFGGGSSLQKSLEKAETWLLSQKGENTEDHVFRLRALRVTGLHRQAMEEQSEVLKALQRTDGGWAQVDYMESDAYATGTALAALLDTSMTTVDAPLARKGFQFLLDAQRSDGSWHVRKRTRSKQAMFDSGFPHEMDQFISFSATCWSVYALLQALPEDPKLKGVAFLNQHKAAEKRIRRAVGK